MSLPAYLYVRWSSAEQTDGDSRRRQLEGGRAFIAQQKWQGDTSREIIDEGVSAYSGGNRLEGAQLHAFEQRAKAGHFKSGVVLVVENLDRLSRQGYEDTLDLLRSLLSQGVTVATWQDGQVFKAGERIDMGQVMLLIAKAELAHIESSKKSERLKEKWTARINEAQQGKKISAIVPAWLHMDETRTIVPIPHRVEVLNWIYDRYLEGKGLTWIAKALNTRQEPTWGKGENQNARGWQAPTLQKYLHVRSVLGEYEPMQRTQDGVRVSKGIVIPDYYPQVIAPDKFNRVQALLGTRMAWGKRNQTKFRNLFSGIGTCFKCGGRMHLTSINKIGKERTYKNKNGTTRKASEKTPRSYLRCHSAMRNYQCDNRRTYRYELIEKGVLETLAHWVQAETEFPPDSEAARLQTSIAEQERHITLKRKQLDQLVENLTLVASKALAQRVADLEREIENDLLGVKRTKDEFTRAIGLASPRESLDDLLAAQQSLYSPDPETRYDARARAHQSLHRVVKDMVFDPEGWVHVNVLNGLLISFDENGEPQIGETLPNVIYTGPNGELDWSPDDPEDKEYQYIV